MERGTAASTEQTCYCPAYTLSILMYPVDCSPPDMVKLIAESRLAAYDPVPYKHPVPARVARTQEQYRTWTRVWPVSMIMLREGPKALPITQGWEKGKRDWIGKEIGRVWRAAEAAGRRGEVSHFFSFALSLCGLPACPVRVRANLGG